MKVDGRCHCGAITYEAEVEPGTIVICNCTDCQMQSGSIFRTGIPAPAEKFRILKGSPKKYLKTGQWHQTHSRLLRQLRWADIFVSGRKPADLYFARGCPDSTL